MLRVAVDRYERRSAEVLGMAHAVAFGYSRHALIAILTALGIGRGDEVVLSPLTCKVVPLALLSLGVRPRYADVSRETLNLDADCLRLAMGPAVRAVLFQHTYGNPAGASDVAAVARTSGVPLVEDCAQCLPIRAGAFEPGQSGVAAIFSNNLMKPMPAGSGGLAVTNDRELAARVRRTQASYPVRSVLQEWQRRGETLAQHYLVRPALYWHLFELSRRLTSAYRSRPVAVEIASDIDAAAVQISERQAVDGERVLSQIGHLAAHRRALAALYGEALRGHDAMELPPVDTSFPLCYVPVLVPRKDALLREASRRAIPIVPWPIRTPIYPLEDEQALRAYGYEPGTCRVAEDVAQRIVGLPTDAWMTPCHARRVVELVECA